MSLDNKTILITRQPEQAGEFVAEVEKRGGRAVLFSMIEIADPDSWTECDGALEHIDSYDGLIFTSTNAVNRFFQRCTLKDVEPATFRACDIYAVGEKTKGEIERRGLQVRLVPDTFSSASLAKGFTRGAVNQKRFLFPRGNLSRDDIIVRLRGLGAAVDSVVVYNTVAANESGVDSIWKLLVEGQIDVVTLASPSAVLNFAKMFSAEKIRQLEGLVKIAAIGPTTAEAAQGIGLKVDIVATQSTVAGFVEAIAAYFD
jgi:uroporphyrinogen-III synthase